MASDRLKVVDLFCGAGGFSEGFSRCGFDIILAIDKWKPAVDTFKYNHPNTKVLPIDLLTLDEGEISSTIPEADVIIGSPPCTFFSSSNKGGKGDFTKGMELVKKFLQVVAIKRPKFWVLENVPRLSKHLKPSYTFEELGLSNDRDLKLEIPTMALLDSADFGVPQRRVRLFAGNFPTVRKTETIPYTMGKALRRLPDPILERSTRKRIKDPNYGFGIEFSNLTDHFYDTRISRREVRESKRLKTDHSFYGHMSFPEDLDRPSRTVTATRTVVSRESMVLGVRNPKTSRMVYRYPTVREAAVLQSYPLDYQFLGSSEWVKWKLVGNSVPVKLSSAIAVSILRSQGLKAREPANLPFRLEGIPFNLNGRKAIRKDTTGYRTKRFRKHVPGLKIGGFRVDLDNLSSSFKDGDIRWTASIHHGTGKVYAEKAEPTADEARRLLAAEGADKVHQFLSELESSVVAKIPDAATFQDMLYRRIRIDGFYSPDAALSAVSKLINRRFEGERSARLVPNTGVVAIGRKAVPLKIAAALYAVKRIEERTREGR